MAQFESVLAAAIGLCDYQMSFTILMVTCVQRNFCPGWLLIMPTADACAVLRKDILDCPAPVAAEILNSGLFLPPQVQCLSCWFASKFLHDPYDSYFQSP